MVTKTPMSQAGTLAERAYMRPMASIYQPNSMENAATVAGRLMEEEVIEYIEVDVPSH